jgi:DNA invertase Pin-like site-specific DNA recombinase
MRAAIYARTACRNLGPNLALALQVEALRTHAARRGMSIVAEFTDEGYSGLRGDRPGLDSMRELADRHGFDVLLTTDPERLARDSELQVRMLEELEGFGVRTIFLEGGAVEDRASELKHRVPDARDELAHQDAQGRSKVPALPAKCSPRACAESAHSSPRR